MVDMREVVDAIFYVFDDKGLGRQYLSRLGRMAEGYSGLGIGGGQALVVWG